MNPEFIRTICPYCGTGCGLVLKVEEGRAAATYPDRENPVSRGSLCVKGWVAHEFVHHPERLTSPLLRKGDRFEEISWEEAIALAASKLKETAAKYGPDAIGGLSSAKCTNEENYLFQKLIRAAFRTNNVDHCARLCHAATTVGMLQTLGSGAMTNSISDLAGADCLLFIGSNAAESHPVLMGEVYKALDRGAKMIVIDPRETPVARNAHKLLRLNPGTDIPLLAGMMRHIVDKGLHKTGFIEKRMENFEALKTFLQAWPVEKAAKETGIDEAVIREVAETYARAENAAIVYCMGITQHACGAANVIAVCDLAMLCGHVGKPFSGIYPLRGQNNVQGACDMGALPNLYPGYQAVADAAIREKFQKAWKADLSDKPGRTVTELINAAGKDIRALYIMAENPCVSDPDVNHVMEALQRLDFLIVQDIFLTETAKFAHLVLPGACFAEKTGTYTNTERRFQLLHKAVDPPGKAMGDFEILCLMGKALGLAFDYNSPAEVMSEYANLVPAYAGICFRPPGACGPSVALPRREPPGDALSARREVHPGAGPVRDPRLHAAHGKARRRISLLSQHGARIRPLSHGDDDAALAVPQSRDRRPLRGDPPRGRRGARRRRGRLDPGHLPAGKHRHDGPDHGSRGQREHLCALPLHRGEGQHAHQPRARPGLQDARVQGLRRQNGKGP